MSDTAYHTPSGSTPRRRLTKAEIELLHSTIYDVLNGDHPQSTRHVFYRLTDSRLPFSVPKTDAGYRQVQRAVLTLRRRRCHSLRLDHRRHAARVSTPETYMNAGQLISEFASPFTVTTSGTTCLSSSRSVDGVPEHRRRHTGRSAQALAVSLYPFWWFRL